MLALELDISSSNPHFSDGKSEPFPYKGRWPSEVSQFVNKKAGKRAQVPWFTGLPHGHPTLLPWENTLNQYQSPQGQ